MEVNASELLPCVCLFDCGTSMGLIIRRTTTLLPLSHIYNLPGWGPEQLEHIAAQTARAVGTHCSCQPPRRPEQLEHIAAVTVFGALMRQNNFKPKPLNLRPCISVGVAQSCKNVVRPFSTQVTVAASAVCRASY